MALIHFQTATTPAMKSVARYLQTDYVLIVDPNGEILMPAHRISIDTLTLSFSPNEHVLMGFDAYTNAERWECRQFTLPSVDQEAALICIEPFDEHGIGVGGIEPLQYTFSERTALLLIKLGEGRVFTRIRCLSCAVCGLGANDELLEIWVEGLNFDRRKNRAYL